MTSRSFSMAQIIRFVGKRDVVLVLDLFEERPLERFGERERVQLRVAFSERPIRVRQSDGKAHFPHSFH